MVSGWLRLQMQCYERHVVPLADGSFYWHLLRRGERVNGGLSCTYADAMTASYTTMVQHIYAFELWSDARADSRDSGERLDQ